MPDAVLYALRLDLVLLMVYGPVETSHCVREDLRRRAVLAPLTYLRDATDQIQDLFDGSEANFRLCHVRPVEAINAVCPEDALLYLQHPAFPVPLPDEVAELLLDGVDLVHQVIQFVELVATGLGVEIEPNMLHVLFYLLVSVM